MWLPHCWRRLAGPRNGLAALTQYLRYQCCPQGSGEVHRQEFGHGCGVSGNTPRRPSSIGLSAAQAQNQEHGGVRPIGSCDRAVESGGGGSWIVLTGDPVVASSRTPS